MNKIKWYLFGVFLALSIVLFFNRQSISFRPWLAEQPLEWVGSASGNGEAVAIIADAARTVVVINHEGELLFKVQAGKNSFVSAELVELDKNNNLYVYDKIFGGAFQESTERVLKYSPEGKFLGVVYTYSYINEDFIITKGKISGMVSEGNDLHLVILEHEGFNLVCLNGDNGSIIAQTFFEYENAFRDMLYCRINSQSRRLVWTTKSGTILEYDFSGVLLSAIPASDAISPYMTAPVDDTNFVYTDILNCEIGFINGPSGAKTTLLNRDMADGIFYYYISNSGGKTYASYGADDVLVIDSDGTCTSFASYYYSKDSMTARYIWFSLSVVDVILFLVLLVWSVLFLIKQKPSGLLKQIMLFGLCIIFGAGISSLIITSEMQKQNTESTFNELEKISRIMAASIDIDIISGVKSPRDFDNEEYLAFAEKIKSIFSEMQFAGKQVYVMIWQERGGFIYIMYDLEYCTGTLYPYGEYEDSYVEAVYSSGQYQRFYESLASGTWEYVMGPIFDRDGNLTAAIETGYNMRSVEEENRDMIIQVWLIVLATTVAFLLIVIECLLMIDAYRKNKNEMTANNTTELKPDMLKYIIDLLMNTTQKGDAVSGAKRINTSPEFTGKVIHHLIDSYKRISEKYFHPELLRAASFFLFFSLNFATALLPMYAASLYVPVFNLPREFIVTLPFTAQVITVIMALVFVPSVIGTAGIRKISLVSAILLVAGNILCILSENVVHLSIAYALLGFSCGSFVLIFNTIIGSQRKAADVNSGFAHFNASYLAGINVGVVFGSIIAQFFPYRTVFWFASGMSLLFLAIIVFSLRSKLVSHYYDVQYTKEKTSEKFAFGKFMFKPVVICTLFMALMPFVATQSFIDYFLPIFGTDNGLGEANIGQLMLLSGLFAILFSATLCELVSKKVPIQIAVLFPLLLDAGAIFLFSLNVSITMMIITIILLAIVNIFALTNIQTYFTILYQNERITSAKALGMFSVVENISMAVGPIVFSYILANDIGIGMKILAGVILGCTIIFMIVSRVSVNWNYGTMEEISSKDNRNAMRP